MLKQKIENKFPGTDFDILVPPNPKMGDYSTNLAFAIAEARNKTENPEEIAEKLVAELKQDRDLADIFEKIEAVKPGFINFYFSDDFLRSKLGEISKDKKYGFDKTMKGKTVMVEYTDPNPFKLFHIGHLMSNTIGEAIARLYEAAGAKVLRANYQGDVGLHVAKTIWGMESKIKNPRKGQWPSGLYWQKSKIKNLEKKSLSEKIQFMGESYTEGSRAYEENQNAKEEVEEINNKIYDRSDGEINELYDRSKKWSLEYFEEIYKKLGTKFDRYFFESEAAYDGLSIIEKHPDVFVESGGAKVFRGEEYGLHTRVFVSSKRLPTYEAKELGVNKKKFEKDNPDLSIIVTGNEINEYFKVLLKVMELIMPEVAARTKHISHGMLRLPGGKMSSRTGEVITADSLIEQVKSRLPDSGNDDTNPPLRAAGIAFDDARPEGYGPLRQSSPPEARLAKGGSEASETKEKIAIGAIKYSILKQSPGHDIIFDFEKSLSIKGDSAPYLQYTYARLFNILIKSEQANFKFQILNCWNTSWN